MEALNQSGQPREFRGKGANEARSFDKWRSGSGRNHLRGWSPHLQYSFLIKLASLSGMSIFFAPCANTTGPSTSTCQHPTLRKHTDKHRVTNIEPNFKSPSTTCQPPPGMGLIYMKNKGNRVEEDIKHRIIKNWKWG